MSVFLERKHSERAGISELEVCVESSTVVDKVPVNLKMTQPDLNVEGLLDRANHLGGYAMGLGAPHKKKGCVKPITMNRVDEIMFLHNLDTLLSLN